jgi:sterol desaturase/sphingolipid hydroxylase (fatty acid hydroxylase superfamily)
VTRRSHLLRNLVIFFWVLVIADYLVGWLMLGSSSLLLHPPSLGLGLSRLPWPLQVVLAFLASDLLGYLFHRMCHRWRWLWRLHSVHHSDAHLDVTTAVRAHPFETSLGVICTVALYVVLGLPFWIEGIRAILHNAIAMIQHANVRFPAFVERLGLVFVTPAMHRVHHDTQRVLHDRNYGVIFSFWDRLFGTYSPPEQVTPERIGLHGYDDESWQTVLGMLLTPLRRFPGVASSR